MKKIIISLALLGMLGFVPAAHAATDTGDADNTIDAVPPLVGCAGPYQMIKNSAVSVDAIVCIGDGVGYWQSVVKWTCWNGAHSTHIACNLSMDHQRMFYGSTKVSDNSVHFVGLPDKYSVYSLGGHHSCTSSKIHTDIWGTFGVRIASGTLYTKEYPTPLTSLTYTPSVGPC